VEKFSFRVFGNRYVGAGRVAALSDFFNQFFIRSGDGEFLGTDAEEFVFPQAFDLLRFADADEDVGVPSRIFSPCLGVSVRGLR
jgi:hypothetical protein